MVLYRDLRAAQPHVWLAAADDWRRLGDEIQDAATELRVSVTLTVAEWWASLAADTANTVIEDTARQMELLGTEINAVSSTLINLADAISAAQALLHQADQFAATNGLAISADGTVAFTTPPALWSGRDLAISIALPLQALINQAVQQATSADQDAYTALSALTLVPEETEIGAGEYYLNDTGIPIPPELAEDYRPLSSTQWWDVISLTRENHTYETLYAAQYALRDYKDAEQSARLLGHWLDQSGTALRVDPVALYRDVARFRNQVDRQIQLGLASGGDFDSGWLSDAVSRDTEEQDTGPNVLDWYYALDGYQYRVHGTVAAVSGRRAATVTVEVFKRYNFGNPAGGLPHPDITAVHGLIDLPQNDIAQLNADGLAKDFNVWGSITFQRAG